MARWAAYLVTVGTEPGVYDDWYEAADRVMKVPGSIYKGYHTRIEAEEAFRTAWVQGRTRSVQMDPRPNIPGAQQSQRASSTTVPAPQDSRAPINRTQTPARSPPAQPQRSLTHTPAQPRWSPAHSPAQPQRLLARSPAQPQPSPARSPARPAQRSPARSESPPTNVQSATNAQSPVRSSGSQLRTSSSPTTGITKVESDFSSRGGSTLYSPAGPSTYRRLGRSATYSEAHVQTDLRSIRPTPPTASPASNSHSSSSSGSGSSSHSGHSAGRICLTCHRPLRPSDAASPRRNPSSSFRSAQTLGQQAGLTPLGLGLTLPGVDTASPVYDAMIDPRSPMRRSASVRSSVPVFTRPSPRIPSISSALTSH
ncbi:hypothetical protein AcV7_004603 [Taiwanofungus camphoratus]|nr:hypothetical protein AcV7_004603 [Antrodia cinnamomea]